MPYLLTHGHGKPLNKHRVLSVAGISMEFTATTVLPVCQLDVTCLSMGCYRFVNEVLHVCQLDVTYLSMGCYLSVSRT